jgi:hypothetical protein
MTVDDTPYERALEVADPTMDKTDPIREAVKTSVRTEAIKRLAALGAAETQMTEAPRRRDDAGAHIVG